MTIYETEQINNISAENLISIGLRGSAWIVYSDNGRPEYIAKKRTVFTDCKVPEVLEQTCHVSLPRCFGCSYILPTEESCYMFEYVEGQNLANYKHKDRNAVISMFVQLFDLLEFMQTMFERPLLHLDIKPENIIIKDNGIPVLIDFDSAIIDQQSMLSCTRLYAAPEHQGGKPECGSDVYSLALVMLQYLLEDDIQDIIANPIRDTLDRLPDDIISFKKILANCLASDPLERPTPSEVSVTLKKLNRLQISEEDDQIEDAFDKTSVICVWLSAEMACELAAAALKHREKVLLIDADWLDPRTDLLTGLEKIDGKSIGPVLTAYLDTALSEASEDNLDGERLQTLVRKTSIPGLSLLMPSGRLEYYERDTSAAFCKLVNLARQNFDLVVILAGPLVYDDLACVSFAIADRIIAAIHANTADLRAIGRSLTFLRLNQLADTSKILIAAHDYKKTHDLSLTSLSELCDKRFIGAISHDKKRHHKIGSGRPYALSLSSANRREYQLILKKLKIK